MPSFSATVEGFATVEPSDDGVVEVMGARGEGLQSCDGLRRRRGAMMEMVVRILPLPSLLSIISLFILLAVNLNCIRVLIGWGSLKSQEFLAVTHEFAFHILAEIPISLVYI